MSLDTSDVYFIKCSSKLYNYSAIDLNRVIQFSHITDKEGYRIIFVLSAGISVHWLYRLEEENLLNTDIEILDKLLKVRSLQDAVKESEVKQSKASFNVGFVVKNKSIGVN